MYSSNYDQPYPTSGGYPGSYDTQQDSSAKLKERVKDPLLAVVRWVKRRSPREKLILLGACAVLVSILHTTLLMTLTPDCTVTLQQRTVY
jgi:type II secretory pathway component PulM